MARPSAWLVSGFALAVAACGDPATDAAIAALGPEDTFVPVGPLHRPGQPCLLCHKDGGRATAFSLAGTVYVNATTQSPLANAEVISLDSTSGTFSASTNCAGNFFVRPGEYVPSYPIWLTLRAAGVQRDMDTPTYREGSCGTCHTQTIGPASPGPVYLLNDPSMKVPPANRCN